MRKPIFGKYGAGFLGTSPSNAERRRGKYGNAIVSKMRKRKRIDRDYALIRGQRSDSETDSEDDARPNREKRKEKALKAEKVPGWFAGGLNYIESHPNLPSVLSYYAQLAVNTFIACLTIFGIYTFWTTVRADVDKASEHERGIAAAEIVKCARDYVENRCGNDVRLPALEMVCNNWELCMNRDPNAIGRARVSAHTFAQIFNSFVEPISYKAMVGFFLWSVANMLTHLRYSLLRLSSSQYSQTTWHLVCSDLNTNTTTNINNPLPSRNSSLLPLIIRILSNGVLHRPRHHDRLWSGKHTAQMGIIIKLLCPQVKGVRVKAIGKGV